MVSPIIIGFIPIPLANLEEPRTSISPPIRSTAIPEVNKITLRSKAELIILGIKFSARRRVFGKLNVIVIICLIKSTIEGIKSAVSNRLREKLEKILKQEEVFLNAETAELDYIRIKHSADQHDEKLLSLIHDDKELRKKFFTKVKDIYVFDTNNFKFFLDENKIDNSYTQFANRIGLHDGSEFLKNRNEVVINFPFKDCVLQGGQSTEEGMDNYFEYEEEKTKTVKGERVTEPSGYKEKNTKRKEIFFNSVLAHDEIDRLFDPKALVNWKKFTKDGVHLPSMKGLVRKPTRGGVIPSNRIKMERSKKI